MGAKVRGYLRAMHPDFSGKTTASQLVAKYPQYQELMNAITAHDPKISSRSAASMRGSLRAVYDYFKLVQNQQPEVEVPNTSNEPLRGKKRKRASVENAMEDLISEEMKVKPLGDKNPPLSEGSANLTEPLPT